ncbi:MAG: hypothetical protein AB7K67_14675 [Hyphomicrobiaceae bacterium]
MVGARIFVGVVFVALALSFLAASGLLIREFQHLDWLGVVTAHSHLFLFFPIFGLLALFAFYLPAVIFTDLYWHHVPYGRLRFFIGFVVVAGISAYVANGLVTSKLRGVWELSPATLAADRGEPAGCGAANTPCSRAPLLDTLLDVRKASENRIGIAQFARNCKPDPLLEEPEAAAKERYCFPAKARLTAAACCQVQQRFADRLGQLYADPAKRSEAARYDDIFMPLKVFFVLILVVIGLMLALWRDRLDDNYRDKVPALERGVLIGAFAMLLWPMMDYAYQETSNAMFGRWGGGPQMRLSLVLAPWTLLLLFYFLRRLGKYMEMVGQMAGVAASAIAVLRYEEINDWAVRLVGGGAEPWIVGVMIGLAVLGFVVLLWPWRTPWIPDRSQVRREAPSA